MIADVAAIIEAEVAKSAYVENHGEVVDGCVDFQRVARAVLNAMREPSAAYLEGVARALARWDQKELVRIDIGSNIANPNWESMEPVVQERYRQRVIAVLQAATSQVGA